MFVNGDDDDDDGISMLMDDDSFDLLLSLFENLALKDDFCSSFKAI